MVFVFFFLVKGGCLGGFEGFSVFFWKGFGSFFKFF